jgi:hypothetical protein
MGLNNNNPTATLDISGQIKITGGSPGTNKVLTTVDGSGLATWENSPAGFANPMTTDGDLIYQSAGAPARLAGATGILKSDGTTPSWGAVDLSGTDVANILPLSSGGTGATTPAGAQVNLGLGALATQASVSSAFIDDFTITGNDLNDMGASAGDVLMYDGATWAPGSGSGWSIGGNNITDPLTEYIGTNAGELAIHADGSERMRFDAAGNVGIGTTTPTQNLTVQGGLNIDAADANDGTSANNTLHFGGTSGETIGSRRTAGVNQFGLDFYTNDVARMSITQAGMVGIGGTNPGTKLHVFGNAGMFRLEGTDHGYMEFNVGSTRQGWLGYGFGGSTNLTLASDVNGGNIILETNNGKVGIGTTTPSSKFHVSGASASFTYTDGNQAAGKVLTSDANGLASWVTPSGGFNTNNFVPKGNGSSMIASNISDDGSLVLVNSPLTILSGPNNAYFDNGGSLHFSGTGRLKIDANAPVFEYSGNNKVSLMLNNPKFEFHGLDGGLNEYVPFSVDWTAAEARVNNTTGGTATFRATSEGLGTANTDGLEIDIDATGAAHILNNESGNLVLGTGGTNVVNILSTGQVGFSATPGAAEAFIVGSNSTNGNGASLSIGGVWTNTSDSTKKFNIRPIQYGLSDVMKLRPVSYQLKGTAKQDFGFLAQEVKQVLPEIVYGEEGKMSMSYGQITSVLTAGMQELVKQNEEQAKAIKELKELLAAKDKQMATLEASLKQNQNLNKEFEALKADLEKIKQLLGAEAKKD